MEKKDVTRGAWISPAKGRFGTFESSISVRSATVRVFGVFCTFFTGSLTIVVLDVSEF